MSDKLDHLGGRGLYSQIREGRTRTRNKDLETGESWQVPELQDLCMCVWGGGGGWVEGLQGWGDKTRSQRGLRVWVPSYGQKEAFGATAES